MAKEETKMAEKIIQDAKNEINIMASVPNYFSKHEQAAMLELLNSTHSLSARQIYFNVALREILEKSNLIELAKKKKILSTNIRGKGGEMIYNDSERTDALYNQKMQAELIHSLFDGSDLENARNIIVLHFQSANDEKKLETLNDMADLKLKFISYPTIKNILVFLKSNSWVGSEKKGRAEEYFVSMEFRILWQNYKSQLLTKLANQKNKANAVLMAGISNAEKIFYLTGTEYC